MASNAHSINDVQAEPACVGGTRKRFQDCIERRPDGVGPSHRVAVRRQPAAAQRPSDLDCLGRSRRAGAVLERAPHVDQHDLPETGPEGRVYRQLGDGRAGRRS